MLQNAAPGSGSHGRVGCANRPGPHGVPLRQGRFQKKRECMKLLKCLIICGSMPLAAQELQEFQEGPPNPAQPWSLVLGARLFTTPSFLGSNTNRTRLEPVFNAQYGRFYLGSSRIGVGYGGGMHLWSERGFTWDLGVGVGDSRPESRSPILEGMGDRRATLWAGTGLQWRQQDGWRAGLTLAYGLRDEAGIRSTLSVGKTTRLAQDWFLMTGLHGSWADGKAMAYDFGITEAQAQTRSTLLANGSSSLTPEEVGPFTPHAGVRDVGGAIALGYRPAPRWTCTFGLYGGDLQGNARVSPLVLRNAYLSSGISVAYRF